MTDAILEKLSKELSGNIDTEAKVLYILAEIRKFIDGCGKDEKKKYPNLYFYCNWVLHFEMDRTPAQQILERFKKMLSNTANIKEMELLFTKEEKNFYSFKELKKELNLFFNGYSIQTKLLKENARWLDFKKLLVAILMDSPLINKNGEVYELAYEIGKNNQIQFRVHIQRINVKKIGSLKIVLKEKMK